MKFNFTFYALMTALSVLTLFSCKDDDDDATIVGTWRINTITYENCTDSSENESTTADADGQFCETFLDETFCSSLSISFTETTYTTVSVTTTTIGGTTETETDTETGTYTTDGDQISICQGADCETSTLTITKSTLTVKTAEDGGCDNVLIGARL